jgi:streptogramin lyase
VDKNGAVYVVDKQNNTVRKLAAAGTNWVVTTIAGLAGSSGSADGVDGNVRFNAPTGLAAGADGNVYVADQGNNTIRRMSPAGTSWVVVTIAGLAGASGSTDGLGSAARFNGPFGIAVDTATNLYVSDSLNGTIRRLGVSIAVAAPVSAQMVKQPTDGTLTLCWNATAGQAYQVQFKTNLNQVGWSTLTNCTPSCSTAALPVIIGPDARRFYRVVPAQ